MNKNAIVALFLSLIPGAGHLYLDRKARGLLYGFLFFGFLALGFGLAVLTNDGAPMAVCAVLAALVGTINMIDMIVTLIRRQQESTTAVLAGDSEQIHRLTEQKERFYAILLSPIPGLSHFQIGLMNRGAAFLIGFFGTLIMVLFVTLLTHRKEFLVFLGALPIIWLYGLFDVQQLLQRKHRGETLVDRTIFEDLEQNREEGRKSRVVALLLSLFPGAGHLYLGLQKRGIQLMGAFLFTIYVLDVLHLSLFLFLIPLIWFYSFFDSLQQLGKYNRKEVQDVPLIAWLPHHQRWMGIVLLVLGGYYLLDQILLDVLRQWYPNWSHLSYMVQSYFQTFIVSTLLIGGGIKLLVGTKSKTADRKQQGGQQQ